MQFFDLPDVWFALFLDFFHAKDLLCLLASRRMNINGIVQIVEASFGTQLYPIEAANIERCKIYVTTHRLLLKRSIQMGSAIASIQIEANQKAIQAFYETVRVNSHLHSFIDTSINDGDVSKDVLQAIVDFDAIVANALRCCLHLSQTLTQNGQDMASPLRNEDVMNLLFFVKNDMDFWCLDWLEIWSSPVFRTEIVIDEVFTSMFLEADTVAFDQALRMTSNPRLYINAKEAWVHVSIYGNEVFDSRRPRAHDVFTYLMHILKLENIIHIEYYSSTAVMRVEQCMLALGPRRVRKLQGIVKRAMTTETVSGLTFEHQHKPMFKILRTAFGRVNRKKPYMKSRFVKNAQRTYRLTEKHHRFSDGQ